MICSSNWIFRVACAGIFTAQASVFVTSAAAGQINSSPTPVASGPGLGFVNIAAILTTNPNNDDSPGALPDNNIIVPLKRFDSTGYIDIPFTITPTAGVTEYQVTEFVDNNTGFNWNSYNMMLGFGTGAGFTQVGGTGDGLDFDTGPPGGNTTPPTSTIMPTVTRPNEDTLVFSGGTQARVPSSTNSGLMCQTFLAAPPRSHCASNPLRFRSLPRLSS